MEIKSLGIILGLLFSNKLDIKIRKTENMGLVDSTKLVHNCLDEGKRSSVGI